MDLNLKDKVILVAASSRGIGFGIAQETAKEGAILSIASRNRSEIDKAAQQLKQHTEVSAFVMDASDPVSIKNWINETYKKYNRIDGLVINAGGPKAGFFEDLSEEDWLNAYNLTLMSAVRMIREVLPYMKKNNSGSIVTITSTSIKEPIDILLLSNVFRSGVQSLIKSLSITHGQFNIRFNNVAPGRIYTDRVKALDEINAKNKGISIEAQRSSEESAIPLLRYGTTEEIGKVVTFLLSDASSYITGSTIFVDGGKVKSL
ncbi:MULTISPECIES: SDR family oxidoreductase [Calditerrivibrio]|jgi:3-oxoacyl-[acyl-carrier protein] reductase|uniref:SDR family oxidoreductase n=1 Tax=Calditerrivibrio TaxID=545865 RepID=UPI003C77547C